MEGKPAEKSGQRLIHALQCSGKQEYNEGKKIIRSLRSDKFSGELPPSRNKTKNSLPRGHFITFVSASVNYTID